MKVHIQKWHPVGYWRTHNVLMQIGMSVIQTTCVVSARTTLMACVVPARTLAMHAL